MKQPSFLFQCGFHTQTAHYTLQKAHNSYIIHNVMCKHSCNAVFPSTFRLHIIHIARCTLRTDLLWFLSLDSNCKLQNTHYTLQNMLHIDLVPLAMCFQTVDCHTERHTVLHSINLHHYPGICLSVCVVVRVPVCHHKTPLTVHRLTH